MSMDDLYSSWIKHVFDHPVNKDKWHFESDEVEFGKDDKTIAHLLYQTLQSCLSLPAQYSDDQITQGFDYLFNTACSNYCQQLRKGDIHLDTKTEILLAIKYLYKDLFNERCKPVLSSKDETNNPLNNFCYMFWDITSLSYWGDIPNSGAYYETIAEVMEYSLTLSNISCQESGLHGLGHLHMYHPKKVETIIRNFIRQEKHISSDLLEYANLAMRGYVQ